MFIGVTSRQNQAKWCLVDSWLGIYSLVITECWQSMADSSGDDPAADIVDVLWRWVIRGWPSHRYRRSRQRDKWWPSWYVWLARSLLWSSRNVDNQWQRHLEMTQQQISLTCFEDESSRDDTVADVVDTDRQIITMMICLSSYSRG